MRVIIGVSPLFVEFSLVGQVSSRCSVLNMRPPPCVLCCTPASFFFPFVKLCIIMNNILFASFNFLIPLFSFDVSSQLGRDAISSVIMSSYTYPF